MKNLFVLVLSTLCLSACKKDNENTPARTDLLTAKSWRISAATATSTNNGRTSTDDVYAPLAACGKDDFYKFNIDNTLTLDEGPVKCDALSPQAATLKWSLVNNDSQLLITAPSSPSTVKPVDIVELSATKLHTRQVNEYSTGNSTVDITYTAF